MYSNSNCYIKLSPFDNALQVEVFKNNLNCY